MNEYHARGNSRNAQLDLFDWDRERELKRRSRAARRIAERYGISLIHATAITALAGLGPEDMR